MIDVKEFDRLLKQKTDEVQEIIYRYLPEEQGFQKTVIDAMNYSIRAGGKRLRPILISETARLFGYNDRETEPFMAAIEMIHTYSLVHDDLPEMDNDTMRRGMKTTHVQFGHAMGVLAGDGLLNYAFEICANAVVGSRTMEKAVKAFQILSDKAGIYGMIGGQTVDVELAGKPIDAETLDFIYRLKTGALIEASMMIGAVIAGASNDNVEKVRQIALDVGMAFQIQDDILDVESTTEELGKPVLSDEKNQKTTYVTLYGLEQSKRMVEKHTKRALDILDSLEYSNEFLRALLVKLITRKK